MTIVLSHLPPDIPGLLVRRPLRQGTEGERHILPSNRRYQVLVLEDILRYGGGGGGMDGE